MDIAADLEGAIKRLEDLAKNIFENGAPHQKAHGADLAAVVAAAKAPAPAAQEGDYDAVAGQLKIAQDNLTAEMTKTDAANAMVKTLQGQLSDSEAKIAELTTEIDTTNVKVVELQTELEAVDGKLADAEAQIATLTSEIAAAKAPPASEDAAQKS